MTDVLELAQALVRLDTCGAGEQAAAELCAALLAEAGAQVEIVKMEPRRAHVLARTGDVLAEPLVLSGHLDTVPAGSAEWTRDALCGDIDRGLLHGRGSVDMKGGVAALVVALERHLQRGAPGRGVLLVLTAAEETGCSGARHLVATRELPGGGPLLVAEPTDLRIAHGHKGVLWLAASARGRSAHGSRPDLGENAILPLARLAIALDEIGLPGGHPEMGDVTVNVGTLHGGTQINLVPDEARLEIDIRVVAGIESRPLRDRVSELGGPDVSIETILDLAAVYSDGGAFARDVARTVESVLGAVSERPPLTYFTDASILQSALTPSEIVILGPGDPDEAHTLDECCPVTQIEAALEIYDGVLRSWTSGAPSP